MKLTVVHNNSGINKKKYKMFDKFFKLLQKKFPLKDDLKIGQVNESIEINYKNQIEINLNTKRLLSKSNGNFENITFNDKLTKFLSIFCSSRYSDNNIGF